jgi:hypothetical protein
MTHNALFNALAKSKFRARFHLGKTELAIIQKKGIDTVRQHAWDLIDKRLGDAIPHNDGKQTPYRGHPVFVAQHATATCCRSCLLKWHKIAKGYMLTSDHKMYIVDVIMEWITRDISR